jgi:hypothetical protein
MIGTTIAKPPAEPDGQIFLTSGPSPVTIGRLDGRCRASQVRLDIDIPRVEFEEEVDNWHPSRVPSGSAERRLCVRPCMPSAGRKATQPVRAAHYERQRKESG